MKLNFYHIYVMEIRETGTLRNYVAEIHPSIHLSWEAPISLGTLDCMLYQVLSLIIEVERVSVS